MSSPNGAQPEQPEQPETEPRPALERDATVHYRDADGRCWHATVLAANGPTDEESAVTLTTVTYEGRHARTDLPYVCPDVSPQDGPGRVSWHYLQDHERLAKGIADCGCAKQAGGGQ